MEPAKFTMIVANENSQDEPLKFKCKLCDDILFVDYLLSHSKIAHSASSYEVDTVDAHRITSLPGKEVPLVVYRKGFREEVGKATVFVDSKGIYFTCEVENREMADRLRRPLGAISVSLIPPLAIGNEMLKREEVQKIFESRPTRFTFEFREPLYNDSPAISDSLEQKLDAGRRKILGEDTDQEKLCTTQDRNPKTS